MVVVVIVVVVEEEEEEEGRSGREKVEEIFLGGNI
jgi:hypothetical protein